MSLFHFFFFLCYIFEWTHVSGFLFDLNKVRDKNYEVIHLSHPESLFHSQFENEKSLHYKFSLFGFDYSLNLRMNKELFSPNYKEYVYRDGVLIEKPLSVDLNNHCYFRGHLEGVEASNVAVSICHGGLEGLIQTEKESLLIYPIHRTNAIHVADFRPSLDPNMVSHVVFPSHAIDSPARQCGVTNTNNELHLHSAPTIPTPFASPARRLLQTNKWIELLTVNDHAQYNAFGGNTTAAEMNSYAVANVMDSYYDLSNFNPPVRVLLTGQITFESADPYTTKSTNGGIDTQDLLLNKFLPWATNVYQSYPTLASHDSHVLMSGLDFQDPIVGLAPVGGMCISSQSGAIVEAGTTSVAFTGSTAAHEVGHTLSMRHDDELSPACACTFVMCSHGDPSDPATRFSTCSLSSYSNWISTSGKHCLDNIPTFQWGPSICGNGVIEGSEQCDCGPTQNNPGNCCQCAVCRLLSGTGYQCTDQEPCCQNCLVIAKSVNKLCRAAQNPDCDQAEYCDGKQGACPTDSYTKSGTSCTEAPDKGVCFRGACKSWNQRCRAENSVWYGCNNQSYNSAVPICQLQYCTANAPNQVPQTCFAAPANPPNASAGWADDGVLCGSSKQCYEGECVSSSSLDPSGLNNDQSLFDKLKGLSLQEILTYVAIAVFGFSILSCLWRCCSTQEKRTYYIQRVSTARRGQSRAQNQPQQAGSVPLQIQSRPEGALPPGWVQGVTSDGRNYWFNQDTGVTSWTHP